MKSSNTIDITVCVLTYNRYKDLENLILSFTKQQYRSAELLIVDDRGTPKTEEVVRKWLKKDSRIRYHKNSKNLGFFRNLKQSYKLARGKVIVFMGDDDIFIESDALEWIMKPFADEHVGSVKASQILYRNGMVNQAYVMPEHQDDVSVYDRGPESYRNLWFESLSITGLAFRICPELIDALNDEPTLYPQVEHMGRLCLDYKSAAVHKYLVGVQSHDGQLNCMTYELDGIKTTMMEDWLAVFRRIREHADQTGKKCITESEFRRRFSRFVPIFFPYNRLSNGWTDTFWGAVKTLRLSPSVLLFPMFLAATATSLLLPPPILRTLIETIKRKRTKHLLPQKDIDRYNRLLKEYYP